jgi:hypothetical protein
MSGSTIRTAATAWSHEERRHGADAGRVRIDVHDQDRLRGVARRGKGVQVGEVQAGVVTGE